MRLSILLTVFIVAFSVSSAGGQTPDPLNSVLAQVGLDCDRMTFDEFDMSNYGGDEFVLPLFRALQLRPLKIPYYTDSYIQFLDKSGKKMRDVISFASRRIDEGSRRGLIRSPLDSVRARAGRNGDFFSVVDTLHARLGLAPDDTWRSSILGGAVPPEVMDIATVLMQAAAESVRWRQLAFRKAEARYSMDSMFSRSLDVMSQEEDAYDEGYYEFIHWVDWKYLYVGAQDLAEAVDWACDTLQKLNLDAKFEFSLSTALGYVILNGTGSHHYPAGDYFLVIDCGGDDTYDGAPANREYGKSISMVIDLKGNDTYTAAADSTAPSFGAGVFGYAFLADLEGNDSYHGVHWSQGAGLFGVGLLWDFDGDDWYTGHSGCQGSGTFGIGCLYDGGGKDIYQAYLEAQGFGFTKGFGLLHDVAGNDEYIAEDEDLRYPSSQTKEHNSSLAQGVGFGLRHDYVDGHSLAGGMGFLYDAAGDDKYSAGLFAQGCAYWYSIGILADRAGNDEYSGIWYVQGSGAHFGVGYLNDKDGDDKYKATMNMAIGAGHDFTVGMLIDEAGNDRYDAPNLSLGGGNANGIGLFWDKQGRDEYRVSAATTLGRANVAGPRGGLRDSILTLGVFLDTGGEEDSYPEGKEFAKNNSLWIQRGTNTDVPLDTEKGCGGDF